MGRAKGIRVGGSMGSKKKRILRIFAPSKKGPEHTKPREGIQTTTELLKKGAPLLQEDIIEV